MSHPGVTLGGLVYLLGQDLVQPQRCAGIAVWAAPSRAADAARQGSRRYRACADTGQLLRCGGSSWQMFPANAEFAVTMLSVRYVS